MILATCVFQNVAQSVQDLTNENGFKLCELCSIDSYLAYDVEASFGEVNHGRDEVLSGLWSLNLDHPAQWFLVRVKI